MLLETKLFSLEELVQSVIDNMKLKAHENSNHISMRIEGKLETQIKNDPIKIKQILLNLLSNANKYTQNGQIVVLLRERDGLEVLVQDQGMGIPEEAQEKIFESYEQVPNQSQGGTGLGLAIVAELAKLVGKGAYLSRVQLKR